LDVIEQSWVGMVVALRRWVVSRWWSFSHKHTPIPHHQNPGIL